MKSKQYALWFLISVVESILTSEIELSLNALSEISIQIEITNLSIDVPKTSYSWNTINDIDIPYDGLQLRYRYASTSYFSNQTYWSLWDNARSFTKITNIPSTPWSGFNVFLLHSHAFPLSQPFYLRPESDTCEIPSVGYELSNDILTIRAHPLENIDIYTIHCFFTKMYSILRLSTHRLLDEFKEYTLIIEGIKKSLAPVTV